MNELACVPLSLGRAIVDGNDTFTIPSLDFNLLSFRSNLALRWEWLPASTAFLIWQQNRQDTDTAGRFIQPRDLLDATPATGDHFLVMKVSYLLGVR